MTSTGKPGRRGAAASSTWAQGTLRTFADVQNEGMYWQRLFLSLVAGLGAALVAYGMVYTHGNPRPAEGDPLLAFRLIPLELLAGVLVGWLVYRSVGARIGMSPRDDIAERMVLRLAMRRGGRFTLEDLVQASPLTESQAREVLARLQSHGRLSEDGGRYQLHS